MSSSADNELDRWRWTYAELLRIERHWTDQVQNQQQRIATMLTVNGVLLAFLGAGAFTSRQTFTPTWAASFLVATLIALALALLEGLLALKNSIKISGATVSFLGSFNPIKRFDVEQPALWLDAHEVQGLQQDVSTGADEVRVLKDLCASCAQNPLHSGVLARRRVLMNRQLFFLVLGLALLVIALLLFATGGA